MHRAFSFDLRNQPFATRTRHIEVPLSMLPRCCGIALGVEMAGSPIGEKVTWDELPKTIMRIKLFV
jgi:hypothetical protein